jgi:3-oxoacyl-(acyl-carrier-protein) synthase
MRTSPEHQPIVIAGCGLVTPLGHSAWQTFRALLDGRTITDRADNLAADAGVMSLVRDVGCVSVVQHSGDDPAVALAERAAREALFEAGAGDAKIPIFLGASKGAMHALTDHKPEALALGPHGYLAQQLSRRLRLPVRLSLVAACASSLVALHHARLALLHASLDRALVVTAEAALLPMFVHSYRRLGVLPPLTREGYRGRPLDRQRCGFMLSELGAAVLIEKRAPRAGDIELTHTAAAADGYDMIRPSPDMAALRHVARQLLGDQPVDLLHPHATGTVEHDPPEMAVYRDLGQVRDVYACKGALGHGLGAAGLVSLVLACLCAKANRKPPMPWLTDPIVPFDRSPELRSHAVFAAGFGGHVAGARIQRSR